MAKRTYFDSCKLAKLWLIESSCKLAVPDLKVKGVTLQMEHKVEIDSKADRESNRFSLHNDTVLKASARTGEEYFELRTSFRADYRNEGYTFDPQEWEELPRILGNQTYPIIRTHLMNMIGMMGVPLVQLPWSLDTGSASKAARKTGGGKN